MTNNPDQPGFKVLALDGGAASGKSSTARLLASRRNFLHVDTGSHYRAVALACLRAGVPPDEGEPLGAFLRRLVLTSRIIDRESRVCLGDQPPVEPAELRTEAVNRCVSQFAAVPAVREAVKAYQRSQVGLARNSGFAGIVMDGRDIGTVILPDADLKVFLTADPQTRQHRRVLEGAVDVVADRDKRDSSRATAPLKPAPDAVVIDNSDIPLEAVVGKILALLGSPGSANRST